LLNIQKTFFVSLAYI